MLLKGGRSRACLPPRVEMESGERYDKNWTKRKVYKIPRSCIIVNKKLFDLSSVIHCVELDNDRVIIYKKDYYRVNNLSLEEQYEFFRLESRRDSFGQSHFSFYDHLKGLLKHKAPIIPFLKRFYITEENIKVLEHILVNDAKVSLINQLIKEYNLSINYGELEAMIVTKIQKKEKELEKAKNLKESTSKKYNSIANVIDRLLRKRERAISKSIFNDFDFNSQEIDKAIETYSLGLDILEKELKRLEEEIKVHSESISNLKKQKIQTYQKIHNVFDLVIEILHKPSMI